MFFCLAPWPVLSFAVLEDEDEAIEAASSGCRMVPAPTGKGLGALTGTCGAGMILDDDPPDEGVGLLAPNCNWIWLFRSNCNWVGWKFNCLSRAPLC